jgi:putative flippase GtrA
MSIFCNSATGQFDMKQISVLIARFSVTSIVCALLNIVILIAGDAAGWYYLASATASFVACAPVGYLLHCRHTFFQSPTFTGFARYTAAMLMNFPLLVLSVWLLRDRLGLAMVWVAPLSTALGFCYNFCASRWAIVRRLAEQH